MFRKNVNSLNVIHQHSASSGILTISLGSASIVPSENIFPEELIEKADQALYRAKNSGRNCTSI